MRSAAGLGDSALRAASAAGSASPKIRTAVSTAAASTISGGLKRSDDSPHSRVSRPRRNAASWTASAASCDPNSTPIMRPAPRMSRMASLPGDALEPGAQARAHGGRVGQALGLDHVERRQRGGGADRVAGERRAVGAGRPRPDRLARDERADRHARGDALGGGRRCRARRPWPRSPTSGRCGRGRTGSRRRRGGCRARRTARAAPA